MISYSAQELYIETTSSRQTTGLEKLEFLTDKAKRLIFQLEAEERELKALRENLNLAHRRKDELNEINRGLITKLESLQKDSELVDEKISGLLEAISDLPLE
ncbi:MAG: hypothetical protein KDB79_11635 [Acidobacteria bacterium]|nr:hypothetical protein [Acidobacteriota bacterium]